MFIDTQYFKELTIIGFDFLNLNKCSDFHRFETLNMLSRNLVELSFYQNWNEKNHKIIPIDISKN